MRIVLWIFAGLVCLIPIAFIGISYLRAPSRDDMQAQKDYALVWHNFADNRPTDIGSIEGDNANEEFVRILADFLNKSLGFNTRLAAVKNSMAANIQTQKLANSQMLYELLEQQNDFISEVQAIRAEYETAITDLITRTEALDRAKLKIDTVSFIEGVKQNKPKDEKELDLYTNLAQNVKALLEFVNTRNGYYQLGPDGYLRFTRPEDQEYYVKIMSLLSTNFKLVADLREQNNKSVRKFVSDMAEIK